MAYVISALRESIRFFLHDLICNQFFLQVSLTAWEELSVLCSVFYFLSIRSNLLISLFKYSIFFLSICFICWFLKAVLIDMPKSLWVTFSWRIFLFVLLVHLPKILFFLILRIYLVYLFYTVIFTLFILSSFRYVF